MNLLQLYIINIGRMQYPPYTVLITISNKYKNRYSKDGMPYYIYLLKLYTHTGKEDTMRNSTNVFTVIAIVLDIVYTAILIADKLNLVCN